MTPHAESPTLQNGHDFPHHHQHQFPNSSITRHPSSSPSQHSSFIPRTDSDEMHDLICVGFGPASLAIAVALHDSLELQAQKQHQMPKVAFLERQDEFRWHAGMQLPGATMQISWVKDLVTLRNPRSYFTFLNYQFCVGRLLQFTNLATFLPLRVEYEAYMKWCASSFDHLVSYNQEGLEILPQFSKATSGSQKTIESFLVKSHNLHTGAIETRHTRNVVVAVGGKPKIPPHLPQSHPRVIHSSSYALQIPHVLKDRQHPYRVVVVGAGQSAAEIFHDLQSRYQRCRATLMIRSAALKPSDDSPFVNEIFDPSRVDGFYAKPADVRSRAILDDKPTNYGVVRLELLERIYNDLYEQRVRHSDPADHQHHILPYRQVTSIDDVPSADCLRLHISNFSHASYGSKPAEDTMEADAVIVAAGYDHNAHEGMLANVRWAMSGGDEKGKTWTVRRDYGVEFAPGTVAKNAGVYLNGCNEATHGLADSLLSILAIRGGEMVDSIFAPSLTA